MRNKGLTLLEVLVALLVLAVVGAAVVALQVSSMRASQKARKLERLVSAIESRFDAWRADPGGLDKECVEDMKVAGVSASCTFQPCVISEGDPNALSCGSDQTAALYRVEVSVNRPRLRLSTYIREVGAR